MHKIGITKQIHPHYKSLLSDKNVYVTVKNEQETLEEFTKDKDALITMLSDNIDSNFLEHNTHLKVISNYAVGFNNIDFEKAKSLNIKIGNTPDVLTEATAELAFILMLNILRKVPQAFENVKQGMWNSWEPMGFIGKRAKGLNVGIIGAGRIGKQFALYCKNAFDCNIFYYSRSEKKDFPGTKLELEKIVQTCDVISVHCPLNDQTKNLIDLELIKKFKPNSFFINTARGEVHCEKALEYGLKNNILAGIGLDVTNPEPMNKNSSLLSFDNVLVTPHIGSATEWARKEMVRLACENVLAGLRGDELPYSVY